MSFGKVESGFACPPSARGKKTVCGHLFVVIHEILPAKVLFNTTSVSLPPWEEIVFSKPVCPIGVVMFDYDDEVPVVGKGIKYFEVHN